MIDFYCDHKEAYTKMFAYIKFLCDDVSLNRITTSSPDAKNVDGFIPPKDMYVQITLL